MILDQPPKATMQLPTLSILIDKSYTMVRSIEFMILICPILFLILKRVVKTHLIRKRYLNLK